MNSDSSDETSSRGLGAEGHRGETAGKGGDAAHKAGTRQLDGMGSDSHKEVDDHCDHFDERSGRGLGSSSDIKPIEHVEPQRIDETRLLQSTGDVLMASSSSVVKKCKGRYRIMMKGAACRKACCGDI